MRKILCSLLILSMCYPAIGQAPAIKVPSKPAAAAAPQVGNLSVAAPLPNKALAVDDVINVKVTYAPHEPIIIGCICDPPTNGLMQVFWRMDAASKYEQVNEGKGLHSWSPPGEHWVEATLVTQTYREIVVFVPDKDFPNDVTKAKLDKIKIAESLAVERFEKRFTVTGQAPKPPPVPVPVPVPIPTPVPVPTPVPTPDPIQAGQRGILILHETGSKTVEWGNTLNLLQTGPQSKYLESKKHQLFILDVDSKDSSGRMSKVVSDWIGVLGANPTFPALIVIDPKTRTVLHHVKLRAKAEGTLPVTSADEVVTIIKNFGG